jgi:DNA modification methylase
MNKINLTPADIQSLINSINEGIEPTPDLLPKLFPHVREEFDVVALDRAKVPTIEYAGKRSRASILASAGAGIGAAPLQVVREFGDTTEGQWRNMIVQGDNLQFLKTCYKDADPTIAGQVKGNVRLIYIDPPFATKSDFGGKDGERSYTDKVATAEFIEALRERLILMRELLAEDGSIYVHLDQKMSHYIKIVMDEIFGKDNFKNEIIWHYYSGGSGDSCYAKKHDTMLLYQKSDSCYFAPQKEKKYVKGKRAGNENLANAVRVWVEDENGVYTYVNKRDTWYVPIINPLSSERLGYPTQKPEELIMQVLIGSSEPGDIILDCFGGSGVTAAVAEKLGRRWISCDFGKHAIYTQQKRILRIAESKALGQGEENVDEESEEDEVIEETLKKKKTKKESLLYGKQPNPFAVYSVGAYDYSKIMELGTSEHKDAYIQFVLGLFQLVQNDKMSQQYANENVLAERSGAPVEIFPVWNREYLEGIRIDEEYCIDIQRQLGRKSAGVYYILAPDTVLNCSDFESTAGGVTTQFKFLKFPYKILEDWSRYATLHDQPASEGSVNELVTSTAFYFNSEVHIDVAKIGANKLQIVPDSFKSNIVDGQGVRFPGNTGIAMILVDSDYDASKKSFDMDTTVFAKDISDNGEFTVDGLTGSVAVIAIDRHGNESKPVIVTQ